MFCLTENDWLSYLELIYLKDEIKNSSEPGIMELKRVINELEQCNQSITKTD